MNDEAPSSILDNPALYEGTYLEFLGFKLIDWKDGYARLEMPVRSDHRNTVGFLHGGVISSLLDIAGAVAGSYGDAKESVSITVNLNVNFMAPHQGDTAVGGASWSGRRPHYSSHRPGFWILKITACAPLPPAPTKRNCGSNK